MKLDELIIMNSTLGNGKLEDALCRASDTIWWEFEVSRILNLWCGSTWYAEANWWKKGEFEPRLCRSLHTAAQGNLQVMGVDKYPNEEEDFEWHQIDLLKSPWNLHMKIRRAVDLVLNEKFSDDLDPCPELRASLWEIKLPLHKFNELLEEAVCSVMKQGALYLLFGWNFTLKRKVDWKLITVKEIIVT